MNRTPRRAFSIIETVVAVAVASILMMMVAQSVVSGQQTSDSVSLKADAVNRANDVVNNLALELRYADTNLVSTTSVDGNRVTYSYRVATGLNAGGPVYTEPECNRFLVYDRAAGTVTKQVGDEQPMMLATGIVKRADNGNLDGFQIAYTSGTRRLEISALIEAFVNQDENRRVYWEARQATVFLRSSLNTESGVALNPSVAPPATTSAPPAATVPPASTPPPSQTPGLPPTLADQSTSETRDQALVYQLVAGNSPTAYSAAGLPAGLTLDGGTGRLTGTPSVAGTTAVPITASNAFGSTAATLTVTVFTPVVEKPTIANQNGSGRVGSFMSYQIVAGNGPTSYSANVPNGMGLDFDSASGVISGTPRNNRDGIYSITIGASNAGGTSTATLGLTIEVASPNPPVVTNATASGTAGQFFSYQISATNTPTAWSASSLPAGLAVISSTGFISGTLGAESQGTYAATISASNSGGTGSATLSLTVAPPPPPVPVVANQNTGANEGVPFNYQIIASNSPTSYGAAPLPAGLVLNTTSGAIAGTPATGTSGTKTVTITASNAGGTSTAATLTLTIAVNPNAITITSSATHSGTAGQLLNYTTTATGSPDLFAATGLPPGVTITAGTGVISGTPTTAGTYAATLTATKTSTGVSGSKAVTFTIAAAPLPVLTFTWSPQSVPAPGNKKKIDGTLCTIVPPSGYTITISSIVLNSSDSNKFSKGTPTTSGSNVIVPVNGTDGGAIFVELTATATKSGSPSITTTSEKCNF